MIEIFKDMLESVKLESESSYEYNAMRFGIKRTLTAMLDAGKITHDEYVSMMGNL